ncbi:beta-N-acetylhexosaminidase [Actinomycetota bacterium Odt1-20B]
MNRRRATAVGGVVAAGAVVLTVALWPDGGDGSGGRAGHPSAGKSGASSAPSPTKSYPLSKAPQTIPAVRQHTPARGPGWKPAEGGRVVVADGALADEGRLLAGELKLRYAGILGESAPRAGDVELALDEGGDGGKDDESYTLTVKDRRVRIVAGSDAGVFYGTRTLKQEVSGDGTAPEGVVRDRPAKERRGFMLDIARKHFTAGWIEDRIREIADLKFNELGLHFSDDQGFRIESDSHPEIVSPYHLTKAEMRRILKLAASRHVTVVPEIDSPGHLGAVIARHPGLQLRDTRGVAARGAVDISEPESEEIVSDLLDEYGKFFPGPYWHVGADEYRALMTKDPEASYPQLAARAREDDGPGARVQDLATTWLNDRADFVRQSPYEKRPRAWNDGFFRGGTVKADKDVEVAYWTGKEIGAREPAEYLREGRKVLNYNDEYLYYVLGQPNTFRYPTGQRIYEEWTPLVLRGSHAVSGTYDGQVLGGSFAVWCDLAGAQTQDQVARGIRLPLRATVQKLWDPRKPALSWGNFARLADRL